MKPVLGIETSCDETAAAVVTGEGRILAEAVLSQLQEHAPFGGVVPEIAARAHLEAIVPVLIVLGWLSYRYFERPLQSLLRNSSKKALPVEG